MHKVNISIDDISPHPLSSTKVLDRCFEVIDEFPKVKFSLFVPTAYWRTIKAGTTTLEPLQINKFPEFCDELRNLPKLNFEICYHGFFHGIPGKSDNDEFNNLNYDESIQIFNAMFQVVKLANLKNEFKNIFRPPAWRMSPEAIQAAADAGIKLLALSPKEYAKKTYCKKDEDFENVVYYNVNPPFDELKLYEKTEIVYHACEWDKNYLSTDLSSELINFLSQQKEKQFCFLGEL
jgi:hypothetical protein|tara:strand:+ start:107 stop:811 length:705 start_codon:yes stop_codon:yes gene_type:complete